ncbi:caldesmon-like isoform X2 [Littorina saxatilis]|uniref:caldesmon-like isoform X2 n=1 Tax=Littorina saxatilis TaxID=31220 RepID=UPI0038B64BED
MSRISGYPTSRPPSRPPSEQLCDLHVYKVPLDLWRTPLNNILNTSVTDTISLGIIRVPPDLPLIDIRSEIQRQLEELAPKDYVFLRSVGRSITRLKGKQEYQLKAKHFLPPVHYAPELFILEATQEIRDALAISDRSSQQSPNSLHRVSPGGRSYRDGYRSYRDRNGYQGDSFTSRSQPPDRTSPVRHYSPLPRIVPASRDGSPSDSYPGRQPYPDSHRPHPDSYRQHPHYDPKDGNHPGYQPHPKPGDQDRVDERGRDGEREGVGEEEREAELDEDPAQTYRSYKESPGATSPTRGHPDREQQHANTNHDRPENSKRTPPTVGRGSPRHSPDTSPVRKGAASLAYRGANGYQRDAAYTNDTNEDFGVAGLTPEDQYKNRDKENFYDALNSKSRDVQNRMDRDRFNLDDDEFERRRLAELEDGALADRDRWANDQDGRRRRAEDDRYRSEEERKLEEARRKAEEEEEQRKQEEEERRRREEEEEQERRRREEEARLKGGNDEDLNRFPSPPQLRMSPSEQERDTESARQRRKDEKRKLLEELEEARESRHITEKEREELVKKAKNLQSKTQSRRNHARDAWKKRYFEEKKKTPPLEEQTNRLQDELEGLHRKLMATLEGPKEKNIKLGGGSNPSQKNNYVIQCTKLQHDIDDLKRRVENAKMKLTAEMKLRNQAEAELRALRAELVQKKINLSLTRSQQFAALSPAAMPKDSPPVPGIPNGKADHPQYAAA